MVGSENGTIQEIFSTNLRKLMELRNYSQSDLVKKLGVAAATVSDWCLGKKFPRLEKLQEIADLLGVQAQAMLKENGYRLIIDEQLDELAKDRPDIRRLVSYALKMDPRMLDAVLIVCEGIVYGKDAILE